MSNTCQRCLATTTTTTTRVDVTRKGMGPVSLCVRVRACVVRARKAAEVRDAAFALEWAAHKRLLSALPFLM